MICWIRPLRTFFALLCFVCFNACHSDVKESTPNTPKTIDNHSTKPLNCPVTLSANTHKKWQSDQAWLSFIIIENDSFDVSLGDDCDGDMKNLWQDIKRFEKLIEKHNPKLSQISGLFGQNLFHFPATKEQIKRFVDKKAANVSLTFKLKSYDRSTPAGGMEIQHASRQFLMQTLQEYINQEHKPIIDTYLNEHGLKMGGYSGEKLQYCYKSFNRCEYLFTEPIAQDKNIDFEFIGSGFDGWEFDHDKQENTD